MTGRLARALSEIKLPWPRFRHAVLLEKMDVDVPEWWEAEGGGLILDAILSQEPSVCPNANTLMGSAFGGVFFCTSRARYVSSTSKHSGRRSLGVWLAVFGVCRVWFMVCAVWRVMCGVRFVCVCVCVCACVWFMFFF